MKSVNSPLKPFNDSVDYAAMGARVRAARRKHHYTQADLSKMLHISTSFLGHVERGTRKMSVATLCQLCMVLSLDANYLLFGKCKKLPAEERQLVADQLYQLWSSVSNNEFPEEGPFIKQDAL